MGLRCSLLGHDYAEPEVEREREEQGNEVVTTVSEIKRCQRCDESAVVSETTEVTALTSESEFDSDSDRNLESVSESEDDTTEATPSQELDGTDHSDLEPEFGSEEPPVDDAVILDDEDSAERGRGEWPEMDEPEVESASSEREWPDVEESPALDPEDEIAAGSESDLTDASGEGGAYVGRGFGEGSVSEHSVDARQASEDDAESDDDGFARFGSAPSPAGPVENRNVETEFHCPRCEMTRSSDRSSLRAGDVCPECRRGYIAEREI